MTENIEFAKDNIFTYNISKKRLFGIFVIFGGIFLLLMASSYFFFFQYLDNSFVRAVNLFFGHIFSHMTNITLLGSFYVALFGGLFFVYAPIEALFATFVSRHNPFLVTFFFVCGFLISYSINYLIGFKLAELSKSLIGARKFYKVKVKLNKYGSLAIFMFNALPLLPSQPLSTMLGIFKYNKTRFYFFFLLGQLSKFTVIIITVTGFGFR
ncbi:MAG: VTT domain-containing protein [Candidatus Woesearchaeota archaeon]